MGRNGHNSGICLLMGKRKGTTLARLDQLGSYPAGEERIHGYIQKKNHITVALMEAERLSDFGGRVDGA